MHQCDKHLNDPRQEDRIQMVIEGVNTGHYHSFKAASIQMNISKKKPAYNCLTMPYYALLAQ